MIKRIYGDKSRKTLIENMKSNKRYWPSAYQKAIMEEGRQREAQILELIKRHTDKDAKPFKETFIWDTFKFSANFDAYNPEKQVVYEIKYTSSVLGYKMIKEKVNIDGILIDKRDENGEIIKTKKIIDPLKVLTQRYEKQIIAQQLALFLWNCKNLKFNRELPPITERAKWNHKLVACYINEKTNKVIYKVYDFPFDWDKVQDLFKRIKNFWKEFDNGK